MKGEAIRRKSQSATSAPVPPSSCDISKTAHAARFVPLCDSRNRKVPGLSQRGSRIYGQLWIERSDGRKSPRRFPLTVEGRPVTTITEAKEALEILRHQRRKAALPTDGRKPSFTEFADTYLTSGAVLQKKPRTVDNERLSIDRWKNHLGTVRIDKITPAHAAAFRDKRLRGQGSGGERVRAAGPRTVNLDLITLRNVLTAAEEAGHLRSVPLIKLLDKVPAPKRRTLISMSDLDALLAACRTASLKNGAQLADYLRFLAFTGAREQEALHVAWDDVDLTQGVVAIGSDGASKNREVRLVDFNPDLATVLKDMEQRRQPDCKWLFPSPQRGKKDIHAKSLRESLKQVRTVAKLPHVGFHHLRVMFISRAVMVGIDYLTIAAWVGHKDGGVLIGRVYGRLLSDHRQRMAAKLI